MDTNLEELQYPVGRYDPPAAMTPELVKEWLAVLDALPKWMDICIENMDEAQLKTPYREGGWNTQQVVHHLADSHLNAYVRLKLALTEDNPIVKPYDEKAWAELIDNEIVPVNISVTMLHAMHRRMVTLLQTLSNAEWERTYFHPEHKRKFPIWEMVAMYAWHSRHHTEHIRRLRERNGW